MMRRPRLYSTVAALAAVVAVTALATAPATSSAQASDVAAGRQKAQTCSVCHGLLGLSNAPDAPNLAGQPAIYTAAQLRAYRSGARKHEVMAVLAKAMSDDDISHVAAWFASLRVEVVAPP
jgi:cytochrome c553